VLGLEWSNLTILGAFGVGLFVGIILTIRLAKILAEFLRREKEK
jgi:predicted exporter